MKADKQAAERRAESSRMEYKIQIVLISVQNYRVQNIL